MWWQLRTSLASRNRSERQMWPNRKCCRSGRCVEVSLLTSKNFANITSTAECLEINIQSAESNCSSSSKREFRLAFLEDQIRLIGILSLFCIFNSGMVIKGALHCQLKPRALKRTGRDAGPQKKRRKSSNHEISVGNLLLVSVRVTSLLRSHCDFLRSPRTSLSWSAASSAFPASNWIHKHFAKKHPLKN